MYLIMSRREKVSRYSFLGTQAMYLTHRESVKNDPPITLYMILYVLKYVKQQEDTKKAR